MLTILLVREVKIEIRLVTILYLIFLKKYSLKFSGMLIYFRVLKYLLSTFLNSIIMKGPQ